MNLLSPSLKALIRQKIKDAQSFWRGYVFYYPRKQGSEQSSDYCYQWSEISTAIKQRSGSLQVNENRLWNMQLATKGIDRLTLNPEQIFDFWHRVPRPTLANGFREGPTLVGNRLMSDVGGGLCQISTTLFQALLWANCEILERHNHSIDAHGDTRFFTLGQDATVAYGYKNLIVRNNSQASLRLRLQVFGDKALVVASVWGTEPKPVEVKVSSHILETLPAPHINEMPGWRVETLRHVRQVEDLTEGWQVNYRTLDVYQPHVKLQENFSQIPA
ncbi:vancomycin resistance protein [Scytonema hofmannii PCC 7110]|uniref:Vancomycin resistance protein n=1 Tax=Scytonema hofmannii PCC 7110 TaxID=128403 RepID=A0A139X1I3_9CYAN|nr:VanW family protein [Scytonema hofmannii]KYC38492.1 vancomycin resistance protein [Scytonema hofmannii PCC 7110]